MRRIIIAFILLAGTVGHAADVELLQSTVVDNSALNFTASNPPTTFNRNINGRTYQRFPMATLNGYQYATYYDVNRNVCLGRRQLPAGAWDVIRFTDYSISSSDSHNVTTLGICEKDGTIHLAFDHHGGGLHYRVSEIGVASDPAEVEWSADLFGSTTDRLGSAGRVTSITYPSFFNAPNGNLMLYYRSGGSGNGDGMIQEYDGTTHDWTTGLGKFISRSGTYNGALSSNSTSRNPYINGISYGGTRLHASWGWRESAAGSSNNHDLNYAYSDDDGRTWRNNTGAVIGVTGTSFIKVDSPGLIVAAIPQNIGLSNQYTHYAFSDGSCHVMVVHDGSYQHYWRNAAGVWTQGTLSFSGSRPKLTGDDDGNLFLVYTSGSKPRIAKGVPNAAKTAWSWSLVYTQNVSEGGEGQLDYSRWESDRVLSIYGQEKPSNNNETPSPLHVFDYKVSTKAILPIPANQAEVLDIDAGLEWTAGIDAVSHRVYYGTNELAVATATTGSSEYMGEQSGTVFMPSPAPVNFGAYYWRIDEVKADSSVVPGMIWQFILSPGTGVVHQVVDQGRWDEASTWDPIGIPVPEKDYETALQLRTPSVSATFAGGSLTILTDGELALRNTGSNTAVVPNLVLNGGNIRAGTGNEVTSILAGNINVLADASLVGYWSSSGPRDLNILSKISGSATITSMASNSNSTHSLFIDNATNDFSGAWVSRNGTLWFNNADAVGAADIEVLDHGKLVIEGDWNSVATLTVADAADASVDLDVYEWNVSSLVFGGYALPDGTYTTTELNMLGVNPVFTGSGTVTVQGVQVYNDVLFSAASDASVKENNDVVDVTNATTLLGTGGSNPWVDRATVYVFQLPDFGVADNPFTDAAFSFNYEKKQSVLKDNDLYGLGRRAASDVLGGDYYGQTTTPDPTDATLLQAGILVDGTATGTVTTASAGGIALVDYLNAQYEGGAGAGEYVFLRLNTAGAKTGINRATLTMTEGSAEGPPDTRPRLSYEARVGQPQPPVLDFDMSGGDMVFSWKGNSFKVQSRTNLTEGAWQDVPSGDIPPVTNSTTDPEAFFRLIEQ